MGPAQGTCTHRPRSTGHQGPQTWGPLSCQVLVSSAERQQDSPYETCPSNSSTIEIGPVPPVSHYSQSPTRVFWSPGEGPAATPRSPPRLPEELRPAAQQPRRATFSPSPCLKAAPPPLSDDAPGRAACPRGSRAPSREAPAPQACVSRPPRAPPLLPCQAVCGAGSASTSQDTRN